MARPQTQMPRSTARSKTTLNMILQAARLARLAAICGLAILPLSPLPASAADDDLLASITGNWQFPNKQVWIVIKSDGATTQCRIAPQGSVYFSKGTFQAPNIIAWQDIWGHDQVARTSDGISLTGQYGTFTYVTATAKPSDQCPSM